MAKFSGKIGYASTVEVRPGVYEERFTERHYYGDLVKNTRRLQNTENLNDDITISNEISIVSDPFANQNFHSIRYVEYNGAKWKITSVNVQFPRLVLTVGGIYNA